MRVVGVLDAERPALVQRVLDLGRDLGVGLVGQEGELALGQALSGVGHHGVAAPGQTETVVVGTKSAVSVAS